ncbi:MAG TPA: peptidyl-prolyl cis-trans isomerase [Bryobacteraceae bacterium]|jgi:parvulin-like peptidyl-prolyl isomerase
MRFPLRALLCALLIFGCLALPGSLFSAVTIMDEIVCKVNGDIITRSQLEKARKDLIERGKAGGFTGTKLDEAVNQYMADVLRDKIDTLLLVQRGKEMDLKVDTELNRRMADLQRQSGVTDPDKFQALVREQGGEPYEDYKNDMKNEILKNRVIQDEITRKIQFKREEQEAYYNDHKKDFERQERVFLSMILVSGAGKDPAAIEKKAKDLAARGKTEKFADLAVSNSDDPNTAPQGGVMDPQEKGGLRPEIEDAIWDKPKGFVTDPIKLGTNYAIFKVDEHPKAGLADFEEVQYEVQNIMLQSRATPAIRAYLTKLRENAFLEIKPGYQDSGAAPGKDTTWIDPAQLKPETTTKEEVLAKTHKKKLLKIIPVPGTTATKTGTSSSR